MTYRYSHEQLQKLDSLKYRNEGISKPFEMNSSKSLSLFIGLGGTGLRTLSALKGKLQRKYGRLNENELKFLGIDYDKSDIEYMRRSGLFNSEEMPFLNTSPTVKILCSDEQHRPDAVNKILPKDYCPPLNGVFLGQHRLTGRVALMTDEIFQVIVQSITNAITGFWDFTQRKINVYIISGINGGAGGGMIVDVPYVVRKIIGNLGIPAKNVNIVGNLYMPNANYLLGYGTEVLYANGYAALKEIDYLMSIEEIKESFDVEYPQPLGKCSFHDNIFDQCNLIEGQKNCDDAIDKCTDYLAQLHFDFIGDNMANINLFEFMSRGIDGWKHYSRNRLCAMLGQSKMTNYLYQNINSSALRVPAKACYELYMGRLYNKSMEMYRENAEKLTDEEVKAFGQDIIDPYYIIQQACRKSLPSLREHIDNADRNTILTSEFDVSLERFVKKAVDSFDCGGGFISNVMKLIEEKAEQIFLDNQKGPFYLCRLLTSRYDGRNIKGYYHRIDEYSWIVADAEARLKDRLSLIEQQRYEACKHITSSGLFSRLRRNIEEYKDLVLGEYELRFKIEIARKIRKYYDFADENSLAYAIKRATEEKYLSCIDLLEYIDAIVRENADSAENELNEFGILKEELSRYGVYGTLCDFIGNTYDHMKNTANTINSEKVTDFSASLCKDLIDKHSLWQITDNNCKIADTVRSFFDNYAVQNGIGKKTFSEYWQLSFGTATPDMRSRAVNELCLYLKTRSNNGIFDFTEAFKATDLEYLKINGFVLPERLSQETFFPDAHGGMTLMLKTKDEYEVGYYCCYACIPLFGNNSMVKYENAYQRFKYPGTHIDMSENSWLNKLPSPIPVNVE